MTNKLRVIAESISGYDANNNQNNARNDYYYEDCKTNEEKIQQIIAIAEEVVGVSISKEEAEKIENVLDADFDNSSDRMSAYFNLEN